MGFAQIAGTLEEQFNNLLFFRPRVFGLLSQYLHHALEPGVLLFHQHSRV